MRALVLAVWLVNTVHVSILRVCACVGSDVCRCGDVLLYSIIADERRRAQPSSSHSENSLHAQLGTSTSPSLYSVHLIYIFQLFSTAFSALTLLVGWHKEHPAHKKLE